jgi:hypothetical protein
MELLSNSAPDDASLPVPKRGALTPRRRKRLVVVMMAVLIAGLCLVLPPVIRRLRDPYSVTAGPAVYRPELPWHYMSPSLVTAEIEVACRHRKPIAGCIITVDSMKDDTGTDLMAGPLLAIPPSGEFSTGMGFDWVGFDETTDKRGTGARVPGSRWHRFKWRVGSSRRPAEAATQIRTTGRIVVWEEGQQQEVRVPGVDFKEGTTFEAAGHWFEIVSNTKQEGRNNAVRLRVPGEDFFVRSIAILSADGRKTEEKVLSRTRRDDSRAPTYEISVEAPEGIGIGVVVLTCISKASPRVLPLNLEHALERRSDEQEPNSGWRDGPDGPGRAPPSGDDWGVPLEPGDAPTSELVLRPPGIWGVEPDERTCLFLDIDVKGDRQPVSTQMRFDFLEDAWGRNLLNDAPLTNEGGRTAVLMGNTLRESRPPYMLCVDRRTTLSARGAYRLAFGTDETTVTSPASLQFPDPHAVPVFPVRIPTSVPRCGKEIVLEGLTLHPRRIEGTAVVFKLTGNPGRIRQINALDGAGRKLASLTPPRQSWHSRESLLVFEAGAEISNIQTWQVSYFRQCRWLDVPFEFTSPPPQAGSEIAE